MLKVNFNESDLNEARNYIRFWNWLESLNSFVLIAVCIIFGSFSLSVCYAVSDFLVGRIGIFIPYGVMWLVCGMILAFIFGRCMPYYGYSLLYYAMRRGYLVRRVEVENANGSISTYIDGRKLIKLSSNASNHTYITFYAGKYELTFKDYEVEYSPSINCIAFYFKEKKIVIPEVV